MIIAGIALFLLLTQNAAPQQPAAPAAPASIEGVVARDVTGESLSKVTVTLTEVRSPTVPTADIPIAVAPNSPEFALVVSSLNSRNTGPSQVVTTASDGRFLFENLKPGTYSLKATLGGYAPAEYGQRGPNGRGMTITLKPGQKMQGASLTMTPGGAITGRVVDSNGDPLSRALVQAQRLVHSESGREFLTMQAVPTDDKGEYRLFWLPPGKYYISATPPDDRLRTVSAMLPSARSSTTFSGSIQVLSAGPGVGPGRTTGVVPGVKVSSRTLSNGDVIEEAAVPVFYPAALDTSTATTVDIRPGGLTSGIDITTRPARVYRIRGMVLSSATGQPLSAPQIDLLPRSAPVSLQETSIPQELNGNGFEIAGVVPGSYTLSVSVQVAGQLVTGTLPIEVQGANLDNVIITASATSTVRGHISAGSTIANASSNSPPYIISVGPSLAGPRTLSGIFGLGTAVRQDNFVLPIMGPGDYRINVRTPGNTYVQSMRFGGQDVLRDGIHIDGPTTETLEVVVSPNAGRLEGSVSADRQKFANATVVLMPATSLREQKSLYQTVQTNVEGHFTFEGISPGSYKVIAWEDIEPFAWFDTEFMQNFENRGTEIVIREGAKESVELAVIPQ